MMGRNDNLIAAFDLEILKVIPEGETDWQKHRPLGVSCAAVAYGSIERAEPTILTWGQGDPALPPLDFLEFLIGMVEGGYRIVGWNSLAFDFSVLAEETGGAEVCARLAMGHTDLMFCVVATQGHYLGLQAAAAGCGLSGKAKKVILSSGEVLEDMDGAKAPALWAAGEKDAVLTYLRQDVMTTWQVAKTVWHTGEVTWVSRRGISRSTRVSGTWLSPGRAAMTVRQCLAVPEPDTSWMDSPPRRADFFSWMPEGHWIAR